VKRKCGLNKTETKISVVAKAKFALMISVKGFQKQCQLNSTRIEHQCSSNYSIKIEKEGTLSNYSMKLILLKPKKGTRKK
jgi:hypothetical protein